MPRKKTIPDSSVAKKTPKKNIIDSMIKNNENDENNDVIVQLTIPQAKINNIINSNESQDAKILIPTPYESNSYFSNDAENISYDNEYQAANNINPKNSSCFWCCHAIEGPTVYSLSLIHISEPTRPY